MDYFIDLPEKYFSNIQITYCTCIQYSRNKIIFHIYQSQYLLCFITCALRKDDFQMFITILTKTTLMFSHFLTSSYFVSIPPDLDLHLSQYPSSDITKVELRLSKHLLFFNFDVQIFLSVANSSIDCVLHSFQIWLLKQFCNIVLEVGRLR